MQVILIMKPNHQFTILIYKNTNSKKVKHITHRLKALQYYLEHLIACT